LVEEVMDYAREQLEPQMRAVDPAARISFEPKSNWPGLEAPPVSDVVGLAKTLADRHDHSKVAYGTAAGLYALAALPRVAVRPGLDRAGAQGRRVHCRRAARSLQYLPRPANRPFARGIARTRHDGDSRE